MDKYIRIFNDYISQYDLETSELKRKKDHTFRVMANCYEIGKSINLSEKNLKIVSLIGLFHDIGRFAQFSQYKQFDDVRTTDHASIGLGVLEEKHILDSESEKDLMLTAIKYHNKLFIDTTVDEKTKLFCNIIRDADKLDIFKLIIDGEISINSENKEYNIEAIKDILSGKCIDLKKYKEKNDISLAKLGLFNNIVFEWTKQQIINNDIIDKIIDIYLEKNKVEEKNLLEIKQILKERLGEKDVR